jgi:hypothetical protein
MIEGGRIRKALIGVALFSVVAAGVLLLLGQPLPFAAGLLLGVALGAVPFASWAWIAARGFSTRRARVLAVALLAGKMVLYGGALFLLVTRPVVNPVAVMIGITIVSFTVVGSALIGSPAPKPKETA